MDPSFAQTGHQPQSNRVLDAERLLVDSKAEKLSELLKTNTEIHNIIEGAKNDPDILNVTDGVGIDLNSI